MKLIIVFAVVLLLLMTRRETIGRRMPIQFVCLGVMAVTLLWGCFRNPERAVVQANRNRDVAKAEVLGEFLAQQFSGGRAVILLAPEWEYGWGDPTQDGVAAMLEQTLRSTMSVEVVPLPIPAQVQRRLMEADDGPRGDESLLLQASMDRSYYQQVAAEWAPRVDVAVLLMNMPIGVDGECPLPLRPNGLQWALLDGPPHLLAPLFRRDVVVACVQHEGEQDMRKAAGRKESASVKAVREKLTLVTQDNYRAVLAL